MISVTRKSHFNAAHRLHNNEWSDEKNNIFYGLCNNKNYHGHNYDIALPRIKDFRGLKQTGIEKSSEGLFLIEYL